MKRKITIIIITSLFFAFVMVVNIPFMNKNKIYINEVRSTAVSADRKGYFGNDYIELYNSSSEDVSLDGWFFSDDESELKKSSLSGVIVPAKSYELIYANGVGEEGNALNFKISSRGEKLFLSNAKGNLVDSVYVPALRYGEVYARTTDGGKEWAIMSESLLSDNSEAMIYPIRTLDKPIFSHVSGFYDDPFVLELDCNPGERIYYTLDGSIPTKDSKIYDEGIQIRDISECSNRYTSVQNVVENWRAYGPKTEPVDKAMVVRAIAMNDNNCSSEVVTHTYFVNLNEYKESNVYSVVGDYEDFFGDEGIFVTGKEYDDWYLSGMKGEKVEPNFLKRGRRWEIMGNLQIIHSGEEVVNQSADIRIHGGSSRHAKIKRMSYYSRNIYSGSDYFDGLLLEGSKIHSAALDETLTSISFEKLVKDRDLAIQKYEQAYVFLNGEFWREGYLLGKYDEFYFEQAYGVSPENIITIKDGEVAEGVDEDVQYYHDMLDYGLNKDLSNSEEYNSLEAKMDIQSYIDFLCANIYLCNMDMSENKNYCLWRVRDPDGSEYGDGRWRWMLYDMNCIEFGESTYYGVESKAQINSFSQEMQYTGTSYNKLPMYKGLKANKSFCNQFVLTFMDMANVNFSKENIEITYESFGGIPEQYVNFFENRYKHIVPYMAEKFNLTGTLEEVTLKVNDPKGGTIQLNTTVPDLSDGSWTGKYYTDYPVTVTAVPEEGYKFVGWTGSVTSDSDTIEAEVIEGGITLEAVFEKTGD